MRDYLTTVLLVSAVTAVLGLLPSDEKMRRAVSFALSLAVLSAIVLPLPGLFTGLSGDVSSFLDRLEGEAAAGEGYLEGETMTAVGEGIARHLRERYDLKETELSVTVTGDIVDGTVILRSVVLTLAGRGVTADVPAIVQYTEKNTGAECEVIYREE